MLHSIIITSTGIPNLCELRTEFQSFLRNMDHLQFDSIEMSISHEKEGAQGFPFHVTMVTEGKESSQFVKVKCVTVIVSSGRERERERERT